MKTLHILNGDSTLYSFRESGIAGDVMVWREILSDGPLPAGVSERDFFAIRSAWICEAFSVDPAEYKTKTLDDLHIFDHLDQYDEVVLWFEFDLHCQVNRLFLLNKIYHSNPAVQVSTVCPNHHPNYLDFRGLGQLQAFELAELYTDRTFLHPADLVFSKEVWDTYLTNDTSEITALLSRDFGNLTCLKPALVAHLDRFPDADGLGIIERKLITIANSGLDTNRDIYREFWKSTAIYGMGDDEVDIYLRKLVKEGKIAPVTFL